jgi:hypothetical protein
MTMKIADYAEQTTTIAPLLAELRRVIDAREELARQDGELSKQKQDIERRLLEFHETSGLDKLTGSGMSITFSEDLRPRVDPEKWVDIWKWAVANGQTQILYKQLGAAKVKELAESGTPLPEGVTLEGYTKINTRRV